MPIININQFGGVSPRTPPRYLPDTAAQQALNCPAWLGSLSGLPGTVKTGNTTRTNVQTLYRYGESARFWFEFTTDVDVVRSAIAGDDYERTYFTDGVKPKKTNNVLAIGAGGLYPSAAYDLGVPAPSHVPVLVVSGTSTAVPEERIYTDTFVTGDGWKEESQPSGASAQVSVAFGQAVTLQSFASIPTGNHNIKYRRIYRLATGTSSSEYLFVAEIPITQTSYVDTKLAADLGEVCPSIDWNTPPDDLKGLVSLPGGGMAGFSGRDVYFCDPYHPFAFPAKYVQTVDYPIVGLAVMDTTLAVLTTGVPYFMQGAHPDSIAVIKSDIQQACVSKRSIVAMNGAVIYASPDGLVKLASNGSGVVTEAMFRRDQWQTIGPAAVRGYQWEGKYVAFFDTLVGNARGFVFDPSSSTLVWHDIQATAGYNDLVNDTLSLVIGNEIHEWYAGAPKAYTWRSKKFMPPYPLPLTIGQVNAEAYPVTFKLYRDGLLVQTKVVTERNPFRLVPGRYTDVEFEISGTNEVFGACVATSVSELKNG
jgi:hypothetical protein